MCEPCQTLLRTRMTARREKARQLCFDHYGRVCVCCGETIERFLQFDHINDGGTERRRTDCGENVVTMWLVQHKFPVDFQVLCANCNHAKRFGPCPHQEQTRER